MSASKTEREISNSLARQGLGSYPSACPRTHDEGLSNVLNTLIVDQTKAIGMAFDAMSAVLAGLTVQRYPFPIYGSSELACTGLEPDTRHITLILLSQRCFRAQGAINIIP